MGGDTAIAGQHGRKVGIFQKRTWTDIEADETAKMFVRALGVGEDHFAE